MKFNGTIFSKPQQDQLKEVIGKEVEAVVEKLNAKQTQYANTVTERKAFYNEIMSDTHKQYIVSLNFTPFQETAMAVVVSPIIAGSRIVISFYRVYESEGAYKIESNEIAFDKNGGIKYFQDGKAGNGSISGLTLYEY